MQDAKSRQKSPSGHHRTTSSAYIFATKAHRQSAKNLLSSNTFSTCPYNMVNFGPLSAEILSLVWSPLQISTGFASWQRYCMAFSSGRQPNFVALNRGRHLCSAGRPSCWALAHILVVCAYFYCNICTCTGKAKSARFFMVALCNRETIYIFILFLSIFFLSFFFFSSPNFSGRRLDVYHTLAHGVALVRI